MISPLRRRLLPLVLAVAALAAIVAPAAAWSNGPKGSDGIVGDGYGTHDWILDQALKVFAGKVPSWLDVKTARLATDDPDTLFWRTNEHVYMEAGYGRGAVHQVVEYYNKAVYHVKIGDTHQASIDIGRLAHYWGDMLQPFHTAYAAAGQSAAHAKYESLVDALTHHSGDMPAWQTADRTPDPVTNIRSKAIAVAAYSRSYFAELDTEFTKDTSVLNTRVRQITGYVLKRASRELADIIYSVGKGIGNAPFITRIVATVKYAKPTASPTYQAVWVTCYDAAGNKIEGVQVDITFPDTANVTASAASGTKTFRAYSLPTGVAKATAYVYPGTATKTIHVKVTSRAKTVTTTVSYVGQ